MALFVVTTGVHYNLTNIYNGMLGAKNAKDALTKLFPYIQIYALVFLSVKSQFFETAPLLFFIGLGLFQTYIAGLLNIASTAGIEFSYFHLEPMIYLVLLYLDNQRILQPQQLIGSYALLTFVVFVKYCLFIRSIIVQLTAYLNIPFLKVKQQKKLN